MSPREGLKSEADRAHSKSSNGTVSSERAETILGRVGFLAMNLKQKVTFLKMEEKEKNKELNKKLKDDEKERKVSCLEVVGRGCVFRLLCGSRENSL